MTNRSIDAIPRYEANVAKYEQDGNRELFDALDELIDRAQAGVL